MNNRHQMGISQKGGRLYRGQGVKFIVLRTFVIYTKSSRVNVIFFKKDSAGCRNVRTESLNMWCYHTGALNQRYKIKNQVMFPVWGHILVWLWHDVDVTKCPLWLNHSQNVNVSNKNVHRSSFGTDNNMFKRQHSQTCTTKDLLLLLSM